MKDMLKKGLTAALLVLASCILPPGGEGELGGVCKVDGSCSGDLVCQSELCVAPALPEEKVRIDAFTANGDSVVNVAIGTPVTLAWSTTNADGCEIVGVGEVSRDEGQLVVTPQVDMTYVLLCSGPAPDGNLVSAEVRVVVEIPVEVRSFTADGESGQASVDLGQPVQVAWSTVGADACTLDDGAEVLVVETRGTRSLQLVADTELTLTCDGYLGPVTSSLLVVVVHPVQILSFTINEESDSTVIFGQGVELAWQTEHALGCSMTARGVTSAVPSNGTLSEIPDDDTVWALSCTGLDGPAIAVVSVTVRRPPRIDSFSIAQSPPHNFGDGLTLAWSTSLATVCQLSLAGSTPATVPVNGSDSSHVVSTLPTRDPPFAAEEFILVCFGLDDPPTFRTLTIDVEPNVFGAVVLCGADASASCVESHAIDHVNVNFAGSVRVDGVNPSAGDPAVDLSRLVDVNGDLDFTGSRGALSLPDLVFVGGDVVSTGVVPGWSMPTLVRVEGAMRHQGLILGRVSAPALVHAGAIDIRDVSAGCFDFNVPALETMGSFSLRDSLVSLSPGTFPALTTIEGALVVTENGGVSDAEASAAFSRVTAGAVSISGNTPGGC